MKRFVTGLFALQLAVGGVCLAEAGQETPIGEQPRIADTSEKKLPQGTIRSGQLINVACYDRTGRHFGDVTDLVLDKTRTQVAFAVIDFKGNDALKDQCVVVPVLLLHYSPSEDRIYLKTEASVIEDAPHLNSKTWSTQANADYQNRTREYYELKIQNMPAEARNALEGTRLGAAIRSAEEAQPAGANVAGGQEGIASNRRVSSWIGHEVVSSDGENVGKINDLVIDTRDGKVAYATLSYGGMMGMGDKLYALPLDSFSSQMGSDKLKLNITKSQLQGMPGIDKENWPAKPGATKVTPAS